MFFHCCTTLWYKDSMEPPEVFYEKGVLRNFIKFIGKHLRQSVFFNKVTDLGPATLFKKRLCHRCFPANFAKFIRTPFLQKTSDSLLMKDPKIARIYLLSQTKIQKRIIHTPVLRSRNKLHF